VNRSSQSPANILDARNGLVQRKVYPVVPPMVEYSLTTLGETMNGVLKSVCEWSTQNFDAVEAARAEYDRLQE
jgi:DNA-binding HxlR family transcriptional regulator